MSKELQAKSQAVGLDWGLVQKLLADYGPFVVQMIINMLDKLKKNQQKFKSAKGCCVPPEVAAALLAAHESACDTCCKTCEACCEAGVEHDHGA